MNIVELLKKCPIGTRLYSPVFGSVELSGSFSDTEYPISCRTESGEIRCFTSSGKYSFDGECMLFPSRENRDWTTFVVPCKNENEKHSTHLNNLGNRAYKNAVVRGKINDIPGFQTMCNSIGEEFIELCTSTSNASEHLPEYTEVEEELVDILISCLTSLFSMGTDIDKAVDEKMKFNESRIPNQEK